MHTTAHPIHLLNQLAIFTPPPPLALSQLCDLGFMHLTPAVSIKLIMIQGYDSDFADRPTINFRYRENFVGLDRRLRN